MLYTLFAKDHSRIDRIFIFLVGKGLKDFVGAGFASPRPERKACIIFMVFTNMYPLRKQIAKRLTITPAESTTPLTTCFAETRFAQTISQAFPASSLGALAAFSI